jgi:hypothetical protein
MCNCCAYCIATGAVLTSSSVAVGLMMTADYRTLLLRPSVEDFEILRIVG